MHIQNDIIRIRGRFAGRHKSSRCKVPFKITETSRANRDGNPPNIFQPPHCVQLMCRPKHSPSLLSDIYYWCYNFFWMEFPAILPHKMFLLHSINHVMCWINIFMYLPELCMPMVVYWYPNHLMFQHPSLWFVQHLVIFTVHPCIHPHLAHTGNRLSLVIMPGIIN